MLRVNHGGSTPKDITTTVVNPFFEVRIMISCDLMSEYYKMCVAAGLNYYRKVPSVDDLFKLSGWSLSDWLHIYECYTFAAIELPRPEGRGLLAVPPRSP